MDTIQYKKKEGIFNCSLEVNGIGTVRAIYKDIKELFTGKSVLNFFFMMYVFIQSGNLKLLILSLDPIY